LPLALSKGRRAVVLAWVKYPFRSSVFANPIEPSHLLSNAVPGEILPKGDE
jgi:hypothetical protein